MSGAPAALTLKATFADGLPVRCIHSVYPSLHLCEDGGILSFVANGPWWTNFHGFLWGRMNFPAAPVGAAGKSTLMALEQLVERVTPDPAPGGPGLAKGPPLALTEPRRSMCARNTAG
jgi:hypothetical protein